MEQLVQCWDAAVVPDSHASVTLDSAVSLAPRPSPPSSLQWAWKSLAEMWVPGSTRGDPRVLLCGPEWVCHNNYIIYVWFIIRCWSFIANY
ncbi:rCG37934 [Rattus norvegicus]|uniref:RCG37934 n=1 Tax=Rattus norvegicus TaxID=10116 RepID=A6K5R3_RAT|nr:rCG37934 [Rattus norvegicus]